MLIAVWIMGALMVTFMSTLFTMTKFSDTSRRNALAETNLRHLEEAGRNAQYESGVTPANRAHYKSNYTAPASSVTAGVSNVEFWNPPATASGSISDWKPDV